MMSNGNDGGSSDNPFYDALQFPTQMRNTLAPADRVETPRKRVADRSPDTEIEAMDIEDTTLTQNPYLKRMKLNGEVRRPEEGMNPDSVSHFLNEVHKCLEFVLSKPKLMQGSSSFVRDYLRTLLIKESANNAHFLRTSNPPTTVTIENLPPEVLDLVIANLNPLDLVRASGVCKKWKDISMDPEHWKRVCLKKWRSLGTDEAAWELLRIAWDIPAPHVAIDYPDRWRTIYPKLRKANRWKCGLKKTGKFVCNLVAHQVAGEDLQEDGLPQTLVVERRFNLRHLNQFVVANASILYFEPETEADRKGFEDFIDYLVERIRAGLAVVDSRRFIFIPPCQYLRELNYHGQSLLGVAQRNVPPLQS